MRAKKETLIDTDTVIQWIIDEATSIKCKELEEEKASTKALVIELSNEINSLKEQLEKEREEKKKKTELLAKCEAWFLGVVDRTKKISTGNISHNKNTLVGFARRCHEFLTQNRK